MPAASRPDFVGSERDVLLHYLNKMRDAVVRDELVGAYRAACAGHADILREQIDGATEL
jgi:hypothetical protein